MSIEDLGKISSITEYSAIIEAIPDIKYMWFRGIGNIDHKLEPGLFRPDYGLVDSDKIFIAENKLLTLFRQRSIPYIETLFVERGNISDWNYLFLMQHFGIPTRLLDFTENALTGLYFALSSAINYKQNEKDAAVYILDPKRWNAHVFRTGSGVEDVLNPSDADMDSYKPGYPKISKSPVAIYGDYNSKRIASQQGVFVLFGSEKYSMDEYMDRNSFESKCIYRIIIEQKDIVPCYNSIRRFGFTESAIYPDISGLEGVRLVFLKSGTICLTAERHWRGSEIPPAYCSNAPNRVPVGETWKTNRSSVRSPTSSVKGQNLWQNQSV